MYASGILRCRPREYVVPLYRRRERAAYRVIRPSYVGYTTAVLQNFSFHLLEGVILAENRILLFGATKINIITNNTQCNARLQNNSVKDIDLLSVVVLSRIPPTKLRCFHFVLFL